MKSALKVAVFAVGLSTFAATTLAQAQIGPYGGVMISRAEIDHTDLTSLGYKLGFQASSDHLSTHLSYSCILAESNTRDGLFDAMKRRHAYAATDNILLDVRATGADGEHIMGDVFTTAGPPKLTVRAVGASALQEVVLIRDDRVIHSVQPQGTEAAFTFTDMDATPGKESYYYVRAVQANRRLAWASPMWITRQAER